MSEGSRRYLLALGVGVIAFIAGIALDLRWHDTHEEFEGTSQQLEAHWLLWTGLAAVLAAILLAFRRLSPEEWNFGLTVVLLAALGELGVHVWHFVAHANEVDPELAHVLLAIGDILIVSGAVLAFVLSRRAPLAEGGV